ncbi:group II intron reverse transcriptase/maturase [Synechococcus sp. CBW1006]|uniref:group II intron reverse transcriptase/maturase n=1 Tax=Synechococcus sp. CBW1006 TaxID=1353138 RepID=UPI0018CFE66A|nr:group II intron reverse transcriptase/maturase [Synechococcus sp. CBW1006]QPN67084.1 group II intron reverse transcriptase/maturase [Synechococcus sp. CBW1006]
MRPLSIPTVSDRIAQMVVRQIIEPRLEPIFDSDSFGYRPGRSAHQAVELCRKRCWQRDWVLDLDIKGFFDSIDHDLLFKALQAHIQERWVLLYLRRWLEAPVQLPNGELQAKACGTPQGGVISPLLANLFLHYAFDIWMRRNHPGIQFERYADDVICHCSSQREAQALKESLEARCIACHLTLHPEKTQMVYCRDSNRQGSFAKIQFEFLGFAFRPRCAKNRWGKLFTTFAPAVSPLSLRKMRDRIRGWRLRHHSHLPLDDVARMLNPVLRGWWQYFGRFYPTEMWNKLFRYFDERLGSWLRQKHKPLRGHRGRSLRLLNKTAQQNPQLFVHWQILGHATVG